jgi:hypothetical protein
MTPRPLPPPGDHVDQALAAYGRLMRATPPARSAQRAARSVRSRLAAAPAAARHRRWLLAAALAGGLLLAFGAWRLGGGRGSRGSTDAVEPVIVAKAQEAHRTLLHTLASGTRVFIVLPTAATDDWR